MKIRKLLDEIFGAQRSAPIAYLLFFIFGFGALGVQKFYLNKIGMGLLYFFTGGFFGLGILYDLFTLPSQVRRFNESTTLAEMSHLMKSHGSPEMNPASTTEKIILQIARDKNGIVTPMDVAVESPISLDEAKKELDIFVTKGFADMEVSQSGMVVYRIFGLYGDDHKSDFHKIN
jgi:hypothetical protein